MRNLLFAFLSIVMTARCATIAHGGSQRVPVRSMPAGAAVYVDCGNAPRDGGITPVEIVVRRGAAHCAITLSKAGYDDAVVTFARTASRGTWANLVPGFVVGLGGGFLAAGSGLPSDDARFHSGALLGSIIGTAAGVLIDRRSGAAWRQSPDAVDIPLQKRPATSGAQ